MDIKTQKQRFGIGRNYQLLLAIGQLSLVGMILIGRLEVAYAGADFFEGLLAGLSITTNLAGLILFGRMRNEEGKKNEYD